MKIDIECPLRLWGVARLFFPKLLISKVWKWDNWQNSTFLTEVNILLYLLLYYYFYVWFQLYGNLIDFGKFNHFFFLISFLGEVDTVIHSLVIGNHKVENLSQPITLFFKRKTKQNNENEDTLGSCSYWKTGIRFFVCITWKNVLNFPGVFQTL